ncbi:hypothetical protein X559_0656 [Paenilisteria newyorkensis]|nr:hypothetical protein X559_0656 [Listeria newyorkensis]
MNDFYRNIFKFSRKLGEGERNRAIWVIFANIILTVFKIGIDFKNKNSLKSSILLPASQAIFTIS